MSTPTAPPTAEEWTATFDEGATAVDAVLVADHPGLYWMVRYQEQPGGGLTGNPQHTAEITSPYELFADPLDFPDGMDVQAAWCESDGTLLSDWSAIKHVAYPP